MSKTHSRETREFGDFQTPAPLAALACRWLAQEGVAPASILEPTCGTGAFLRAALEQFPRVRKAIGADINPQYLREAGLSLARSGPLSRTQLIHGSFYHLDWPSILRELPAPLLILGNPPWITNASHTAIAGDNAPSKSNFKGLRGVEAITGKSNFDISEYMLLQMLQWVVEYHVSFGMLCKSSVARKILSHAWEQDLPVSFRMAEIDAAGHWGVAVAACMLLATFDASGRRDCTCYSSLEGTAKSMGVNVE
jgi:methylase of polypeptide subunit release factors